MKTFRQLRDILNAMRDEKLDLDATVYLPVADEYFGVEDIDFAIATDVLDEGHPYLIIKE